MLLCPSDPRDAQCRAISCSLSPISAMVIAEEFHKLSNGLQAGIVKKAHTQVNRGLWVWAWLCPFLVPGGIWPGRAV